MDTARVGSFSAVTYVEDCTKTKIYFFKSTGKIDVVIYRLKYWSPLIKNPKISK